MAGLTKEQRAEREAKNSIQVQADNSIAEPETQDIGSSQKTVSMVRSEPMHERGPVAADVHPDEVENWKAVGWKEV